MDPTSPVIKTTSGGRSLMTARANSHVSDSLSRCSLRPNVGFVTFGVRPRDVTPARRALGLEYGNALADDVERCELVEEQIVAALGHAANGRGGPGGHPERRVRFLAGRRLDQDVVEGPEAAVVREALP